MDNKQTRSYAKESFKTSPVGIRFDKEKLDLVKGREKLNTNQKVVDFLLNKYWWELKVAVPTHKEVPPLNIKSEPYFEVQKPVENKMSVVEWINEKREILLPELFEAFIDRLNACKYLTDADKKTIRLT